MGGGEPIEICDGVGPGHPLWSECWDRRPINYCEDKEFLERVASNQLWSECYDHQESLIETLKDDFAAAIGFLGLELSECEQNSDVLDKKINRNKVEINYCHDVIDNYWN